MTEEWINNIENYCYEHDIEVDIYNDYIELVDEVTLDQVGDLYDWFCPSYPSMKIEFVVSGGTQYAFRITKMTGLEKIYNSQESLGEDFEKVLNENLWDLYDTEEIVDTPQEI
jgi:hypothetical protein